MHAIPDSLPADRPVDRWFGSYSNDHQNALNQKIHVICVPLILWSVIALLWVIPVPAVLGRPGAWAGLAMALASIFYWRLSRPLGAFMLLQFVLMGFVTHLLMQTLGAGSLLWLAIGVFVLAWIGQFIGHKYEGKKPSFLADLVYLLIGPAWVVGKLMRRLGIAL